MLTNILVVIGISLIASINQVLLKKGATQIGRLDFSIDHLWHVIKNILTNPYLIAGFGMMGINILVWIIVLSRMNLSVAHPLISFSYIFSVLGGIFFFQETFSLSQMCGMALILIGSFLLIHSS